MIEKHDASYGEIVVEVSVDAPVDRVWKGLVDEIGRWWPEEFYAGGVEGERSFCIEAEPGGRMLETWDQEGGLLWGTVITVEPEVKLQVVGYAFPEWGGPGTWFGTWELEEADEGTVLQFTEATVGKVTRAGVESKQKGWTYLFGGVLKAFVEGRPIPSWVD